jgi:ADP-heptose:LPS heptosyltransferase
MRGADSGDLRSRNDRSAFLALLSRAKNRIVSYRVKRRARFRRMAYNQFVEHRMRDMHTIDYNLSLLEPLGIRDLLPPVQLSLTATATEKANDLLKQRKITGPFIIFHPGSARAEKFWASERWAEVIEHARKSFNVVLTGGPSDLEQAHLARIKSKLSRPNPDASQSEAATGLVDLSGQTDLLTLAALIAQARLLVTVDSAPVHLAAAARTPQVVLFGPTNPYHWRPRQSPVSILQGDSPTPVGDFSAQKLPRIPMNLISTEAVINAMDSLLSNPAA